MAIDIVSLVVSMDAAGAGTVTSARPIQGYIVEVNMPNGGTTITVGGTTDFTFTRGGSGDSGTVFQLLNHQAPFRSYPSRELVNNTGGTTAYALGIGPVVAPGVPVAGYLTCTVSSGRVSGAAATINVVVDGAARS